MEREHKLAVLGRIASEFRRAGITWAAGASLLLFLRGRVPDFHALDLMILTADAGRAGEILARLGEALPERANGPLYETEVFREYRVDGVEVDMMAGMTIRKDGVPQDCTLYPEDIDGAAEVFGERVPLQRLACWVRYYALMGRPEKAALAAGGPGEAPGRTE